ncbi:alpha/beta fold hydrolase [Mycolicibacterium litorale]|uniref:Oxidoreductase n=1 Tax=Mycolicibacterium litorale TaxID=758802 RepID=A0AAD1IN56_9MYCO|nr:alpha/beta hydrolase [Mycolicibacterium litorale]MCV7417594.1 alpha/beta hydrolase [Mycolicibacterium litorale]TDX99886.1 pimeloyl-ACP methyl ester carboxylesterase [Mycolicibacterium litorale]BBY18820.1 oxidoreductase [Mycolicibacterium litorale]
MPTLTLPTAALTYRAVGPETSAQPPVLFVHGALVDHRLWDPAAAMLAARGFRCILPDWPLGSHRIPVDAELSPAAVAEMVRDVITALDLREVTLVGNDTGGAICQLAVTAYPGLVDRLVLTNCDAFDKFPPFPFNVVFAMLRGQWSIKLLMESMRVRALRHSPFGYGLLCRPRPELTASWVRPCQTDPRIRANLASLLRHIATTDLMEVGRQLPGFTGPVRVVWGMRDRCFTPALGRRLAAAFPDATMVEVPHASTFVALDAPDAVADAVEAVSAQTAGAQ